MPIPVVCGNCQTRLNAPDAAAGRKVKCPKCQAVMAVPALPEPPPPTPDLDNPFSFDPTAASPPPPPPRRPSEESRPAPRAPAPPPPPEPETPPAGGGGFDFGAAVSSAAEPPARGRGDRRRRDEDEEPPRDDDRPRRRRPRDDDAPADEGDDRPRGRGDKSGGKKSPVLMIVLGLGFVFLTCCGGGGFGAYYFVIQPMAEKARAVLDAKQKQIDDANKVGGSGGGVDSAPSTPVPTGWKEFRAKDGSFKGYFPVTPKEESQPQKGPKGSSPTVKQYMADGPNDEVTAGIVVLKFPAGATTTQKTTTMEATAGLFAMLGGGKSDPKEVTWLGQKGKEVQMKEPGGEGELRIRQVLVGNTGYVGMLAFKGALKQDLVDGFFNNVEALSK